MPCTEKRARLLLAHGRARVHRLIPFTIRLVDRLQVDGSLQSLRLKLDPGSQATGMALVREAEIVATNTGEIQRTAQVLWLAELAHRGHAIRDALTSRRAFRRRRSKLRYRPARFANRTHPAGWLAPSLQHRVDTTLAWVERVMRMAPVTALSQELVRFDMQQMENPEISGAEYQQGTLAGYEVRGYLLREKRVKGFQTGDQVRAEVTTGKKTGSYQGRVAVRASGSFNIQTPYGVVQGIHHRFCRLMQRADGYGYSLQPKIADTQGEAGTGAACAAALSLPGMNAGVSRAY